MRASLFLMMRRFGITDVRPLTGVRRDEAVPFGLEVARVADYAIRHQTFRRVLFLRIFENK